MARPKAKLGTPVAGSHDLAVNNYFTSPKSDISFVKSGCTLLDCALGGGWALGRVVNIVGDKSTAKTALAVEAVINFLRQYPSGRAAYRDAEAAFDQSYAEAMGLPLERVDFGDPDKPLITVEELFSDLEVFLMVNGNTPGIFVLDSLDALTTENEQKRDFGDVGWNTAKAVLMSSLFKELTRKIEQSNVLLVIVSQVRDNIGALFGEKNKRSGGRALDFYASQIVWLAKLKSLDKTINKVKRVYGVKIKANVKKNKVGLPHRTCEFDFVFGYGIDDISASVNWLDEVGRYRDLGISKADIEKWDDRVFTEFKPQIDEVVKKVWAEVDQGFLPTRRKYE